MIAWYWCVVAFFVGEFVGIFFIALVTAGTKSKYIK